MKKILTKAEIYRRMERMLADPDKPMSNQLFADLCGLSREYLHEIFVSKNARLTEHSQICISIALEKLERGDVLAVRNRDRSKSIKYRKTPVPRMEKSNQITLEGGEFRLKIGPRNKSDYSQPSLQEKMKWRS